MTKYAVLGVIFVAGWFAAPYVVASYLVLTPPEPSSVPDVVWGEERIAAGHADIKAMSDRYSALSQPRVVDYAGALSK